MNLGTLRHGPDEYAHKPTAADVAIAESEVEYQSAVGEAMAQLVKSRGPKVQAQRTAAPPLAPGFDRSSRPVS